MGKGKPFPYLVAIGSAGGVAGVGAVALGPSNLPRLLRPVRSPGVRHTTGIPLRNGIPYPGAAACRLRFAGCVPFVFCVRICSRSRRLRFPGSVPGRVAVRSGAFGTRIVFSFRTALQRLSNHDAINGSSSALSSRACTCCASLSDRRPFRRICCSRGMISRAVCDLFEQPVHEMPWSRSDGAGGSSCSK